MPPLPSPPAPRRRRTLEVLVACVPVVVLLAVAAAALASWQGSGVEAEAEVTGPAAPDHPDAWDPRVAPLAAWVEEARDLRFTTPVEVELLSVEDYRALTAVDPTEGDDDAEAAAADSASVLRALGLVHGEVDLGRASGDLVSEGSLAYYDHLEETVYVRGQELTPAVRATLVHELTHVLQDQHFDLDRLSDPDFDRAAGLRAMAEGDARRIERAYVDEELTAAERVEYAAESDADRERSEDGLDDVPPALVTLFSAPYALGEAFLTFVSRVEGPGAQDAVLEDPPTEADLLDPARWVDGGAIDAEPAPEVDVPDGAEVVEEDALGPLGLFLVLATRGAPADALLTVDGWAGDAYVAYEDDEQVCVAATVVGETGATAQRIADALAGWADRGADGAASVERVDDEVHLSACDPGDAAEPTGEVGPDVLAVPAVRSDVESTWRSEGLDPERSRCAADRIIAALTVEELLADPATADPAIEQRVVEAVTGC